MKPVQTQEFWEERINDAKKIGKLHYSVYNAHEGTWKKIEDTHRAIMNSLVSGRVLDAGCGYGRLSEEFEHYVGVDISEAFISLARDIYPNKRFVVASLDNLPFSNDEFNWAICVSIKGMIKANGGNWEDMEKELKRVAEKVLILEYSSPGEYEII